MEKTVEKCAAKASPKRCFILVNNAKQALDARNSFKNNRYYFFIGT